MEQLDHRIIKECILHMQSSKITEKKKGIKDLKELLNRTDVVKYVNKCSENNSNQLTTWDSLFKTNHNALLLELDRLPQDSSRTKVENAINPFTGLLCAVVITANADIPHINCDTIIIAVLKVLKSEYYRNIIGDTYILILNRWVFPHWKYWCKINLANLTDLYECVKNLFIQPPQKCKKSSLISVLNMIIKIGCEYSSLALSVKKSIFGVLKPVIKDVICDKSVDFQLSVLTILVTVSEKLQKECRKAICKFGEEVLENVLLLYQDNIVEGSSAKNEMLFDFLLIIVELHHPGGITELEGAYAYNWPEWKNKLRKISYVTATAMNTAQKYGKLRVLPEHFVELVVEVHKQIFSFTEICVDVTISGILNESVIASDHNASKKRRIVYGFSDIIDRLKNISDRTAMWPWLSLLSSLLSTYPSLVDESNYMLLLQNMSEFLATSKESFITDYLCRCCIALIEVRHNLQFNAVETQMEKKTWDSIWNTVLRTIGLNQSVEWSNNLLRCMLTFMCKAATEDVILKLYLSGVVRVSEHSLLTLLDLRQRVSFPNSILDISVWSSLLCWMSRHGITNDCNLLNVSSESYAHILILICLKNNIKNKHMNVPSLDLYKDSNNFISFVEMVTLGSYESEFFLKFGKSKTSFSSEENNNVCVLNNEAFEQLVNSIEENSQSLLEMCGILEDKLTAIRNLNSYTIFLLHLQKFMSYYHVNPSSRIDDVLKKIWGELFLLIKNVFVSPVNLNYLLRFLHSLSDFLKHFGTLPLRITKFILNEFYPMLQYVFEFIEKTGYEEDQNDMESEIFQKNKNVSFFDTDNLPPTEQVKVEACKILVYYSYNYDEILPSQYKILERMLEILVEKQEIKSSLCLLQMSSITAQASLNLKNLDSEMLLGVTLVIQMLCERDWYVIEESAIVILKLMQHGIIRVCELFNNTCWENLKILVNGIEKLLKNSGPRIVSEIVHCWGYFCEIDKSTDFGSNSGKNRCADLQIFCENVFDYLKHEFLEVRVTAVYYVSKIFNILDQSLQNNNILDGEKLFLKFSNNLFDSFIMEGEITEEEIDDEKVNRPLSALYSLASVICCSQMCRRKALYLLFHTSYEKQLDQASTFKILKLIEKHLKLKNIRDLIRDNFLFVLYHWFDEYKTFQNFPHQVVECASIKDFYSQFLREIAPISLYHANEEYLENISTILDIPLSVVVKECFHEVMAVLLNTITKEHSVMINENTLAGKINKLLINAIGGDSLEELMSQKLPNVLICILRNFHDPKFEVPDRCILPDPVPFVSDETLVKETISYLQSTAAQPEIPLMCFIAREYPQYVQQIFQQLYIDVRSASTPEVRLEAFQKYALFCELLFLYYEDLHNSRMIYFITNTIINNLLSFMSNDANDLFLTTSSIKFFQKFVMLWLSPEKNHTASVFNECLSSIVGKLVPLITERHGLGEVSINLLCELIQDKSENLAKSIQNLDPFPDLPEFGPLRTSYLQMQETQVDDSSLINDIQQFLNAGENSSHSVCRLEGLKFLRKQLLANKYDFNNLFRNLSDIRGFSEDCAESIPHQLICTLLKLIGTHDEKVGYEAVCCLSEIGLVDLRTLVLQPNCDTYDRNSSAKLLVAEKLCKILKDCIISKDVEVVNAACKTLYATLSSKEGLKALKVGDFNKVERQILIPFVFESTNNLDLRDQFSLEKFKENINTDVLWSEEASVSYDKWIVNLVGAILDSFNEECFLNVAQSVSQIKVSFAEDILKYLIFFLLNHDAHETKEILSNCMNQFFKNNFNSFECDNFENENSSPQLSQTKFKESIRANKLSVKCLLDVIHFIRLKQLQPHLNYLNLNYLYVAKAAQYCSAYFTSILYAELWINSQIINLNIKNDGDVLSVLEEIGNYSCEDKNELLNILRKAFSKIGDSHALYGCGSSLLLDTKTRILHHKQIENWPRVMEMSDIQLQCTPNSYTAVNDLALATGFCGLNYLQHQYVSSLTETNEQLQDEYYKGSWKLHKWDLPEPCNNDKTFSYYQYAALKEMHQRNTEGVRVNVEEGRRFLIPTISRIGLESTNNIYHILSKLQCLQDIEDYLNLDSDEIFDKWKTQDKLNTYIHFKYKETILSQRIHMIDMENELAANFGLTVVKLARKEQNFNFADVCISIIKNKKSSISKLFELKLLLEEARLLWDRKETHIARYLLKDLMQDAEALKHDTFYSTLLRIYGNWLAEIKLENADTIFDSYLLLSLGKIENRANENDKEQKIRLKTYKCVAEFADSQYQQISKYMKSDSFGEQVYNVTEAKKQSDALEDQSDDVKRTKMYLANLSKMADSQVKDIQSKKKRYLILAMRYYLKFLAEGENEDLRMFRVISLWLDNKNHVELHKEIREILFKIPSYKFVLVLPQLIAHLTRKFAECFGHALNQLIEKCAVEHPHHTLPLILSLANYTKDEVREERTTSKVSNEERVLAAREYMIKFRLNDTIGVVVTEMENLSDAFIQFAYFDHKRSVNVGEAITISRNFSICKINNFENMLCPTVSLPVNKNADYSKIIGVRRIEPKFMSVTGINTPKKINCVCTDGVVRYQLIKGKDDMRQDAIMQQVFTIMNKLLSENKHTSNRKLLIRTYKVVPLSQRSGVLEWCMNTMSLGDYLTYKNENFPGAHRRFRPKDITTKKARDLLTTAKGKSDKEKLKEFQEVCQKIKPVFRYFFLEKFPSPTMWFERKLAYIHSVAVTSMVGYIIGLGDRHVQNILIDEKTAEVIHIDFGIAFDQGSLLNCPEYIPFRLTRDIEDGMGIFAIDGIFRRCCEQTLSVLRQNKNIIQTTIEIFIHDPLYQWTLTPEKKASVQRISPKNLCPSASGTTVNVTASRALSKVVLKLQGLEEGTTTTVEGQVNRLIQQAKDFENLSKLFCGWQAYL